MAEIYDIPKNVSSPVDLLGSANKMVDGFLGIGILLIIFVVTFVSVQLRYGSYKAFAFSSFLTLFFSAMLAPLGLVTGKIVITMAILFGIAVILTFAEEKGA